MKDEKFFSQWKPIHNKGLLSYLITRLLATGVGVFVPYLILKPFNVLTTTYWVSFTVSINVTTIIISIYKWFDLEQRYKDLLNLREEVKHETSE